MGKIIVIDGLDGSGKATQTELVYKYLKEQGYNVHKLSFPCYESKSSEAVKMYLSGEIGVDAKELNPYMCSSFYAIDRAIQYKKTYEKILEDERAIILCDRYLSANIIHQGSKIKDKEEREKFFRWVYEYEVGLMGIPKDDLTIYLDVPVEVSQELITIRYNQNEDLKDIHENNIQYLKDCYECAQDAIEIMPKLGYNWRKVSCVGDRGLRGIEEIYKDIIEVVKEYISLP